MGAYGHERHSALGVALIDSCYVELKMVLPTAIAPSPAG